MPYTLDRPSKTAEINANQRRLGDCGVALTVAIKSLQTRRDWAIVQIRSEMQNLAHFEEPEMRQMMRIVLSFLIPEDWVELRSLQGDIERFLMAGDEAA